MKSVSQFTFHPTTFSGFLSCIAIIAVVGLAIRACRQTKIAHQNKAWFWTLEALRVLIVVLAVALLNQPEWIQQNQPAQKPTILVLRDNSRSMQTTDVKTSNGLASRNQVLDQLISQETLQTISENYSIIQGRLSPEKTDSQTSIPSSNLISPRGQSDGTESMAPPGGMKTDFSTPIEAALNDYPTLRAIILASDGDWNSGNPPTETASQLRSRNIPLFAIPFGSQDRLPDIELVAAEVPTFGIVGKALRIPVTIESSLPRVTNAQLIFESVDSSTGGTIGVYREQKEIQIKPMGRTVETISWTPKIAGDFTLTVTVPALPEEKILDNNSQVASIAIRTEKLKVLVVDSIPRWEYRYLRNALSRDPGVDVSCLLFHPGLSKVGGGNRDYIPFFPETQEELSKYDVVFLGDVGVESGQLTLENARMLRGLVEQQASGLVFLPGSSGRQASLIDSPLGELLPVVNDSSQPTGWGSRMPSRMELTELGRRSLLTRLAESPDENLAVWGRLPGFHWYAPVVRAKAGADVLAVHQEATTASGRVPLLVTQTRGAGKVLYMATDGAWRWRKGVEDQYHYRFWGQVVRWMAYQRNMAKGETMRLFYSPEQPRVRQTVFATANVQASNGEPLMNGQVTLRIEAPSGQMEQIQMISDGGDWGAYTGSFTPLESGPYRLTLQCAQTQAMLETNLLVLGGAVERIGKPARPEVLEEMASLSGGKLVLPENIATISHLLTSLPTQSLEIQRFAIWSSPLSVATLIGMATMFWIGRKMLGLL
jgi:hypothetical protein